MGTRNRITIWLTIGWLLSVGAGKARAIGWDSNDFLITGGPNFPDRIGVFDFDLTFKGYLDTNYTPVRGMDFDAAGNLVAVASFSLRGEVRVYNSAGNRIAGFVRNDGMLGVGNDVKVAPDGSYLVGTGNIDGGDGVRQFATDGTFVRQYGSGNLRGVAVLPGNVLWTGGPDDLFVTTFDLASGSGTGTIALTSPMEHATSMTYLSATNTVLIADSVGRAVERDLNGTTLVNFEPGFITSVGGATRGPDGDVFATAGNLRVLQWHADGTYVGSISMGSAFSGGVSRIVWAGNVPEPGAAMLGMVVICLVVPRRRSARCVERN